MAMSHQVGLKLQSPPPPPPPPPRHLASTQHAQHQHAVETLLPCRAHTTTTERKAPKRTVRFHSLAAPPPSRYSQEDDYNTNSGARRDGSSAMREMNGGLPIKSNGELAERPPRGPAAGAGGTHGGTRIAAKTTTTTSSLNTSSLRSSTSFSLSPPPSASSATSKTSTMTTASTSTTGERAALPPPDGDGREDDYVKTIVSRDILPKSGIEYGYTDIRWVVPLSTSAEYI